ncbi:hypothetical protein RchiOBHm_Chr2g0116341 [Rosa chinensis]|uniref:Transmembrane protein n=1 Tax=Rosa chinensis TaxID=74649 RepID=A0A2P6RR82_ROSCH|nr:uncharacterized protein LOC112183894 isoform X1 [Rosa chinensis]PRQ48939.1 hypothetical protein RchiOBHm_Chr2g0116341 [Rosa chinensis]
MYNFGDELTLETYRVPWLIWIQVIVMVLLLLLLYCFSMLVLDLPDDNTKPSSSSTRLVSSHNFTTTVSTNRLQSTQVGESMKGEIISSTSRVMRAEDMVEMEGSPTPIIYLHPCYYFRLARLAFLKCLGLDPSGESLSTPQRGKRKES